MNREIKFRAWFKREKRMIYSPMAISGGVGNDGWVLITAWVEGMDCNKAIYGRPEFEIMQFTGLHDRDGKEIYEGDIVRTENTDVSLSEQCWEGIVTYQHCMYVIVQPDDSYTPALCNHKIVSLEITGNIYEHPELLKENA